MFSKILVMGASTAVGIELVRRLVHSGIEITAAVKSKSKLQNAFHYPSLHVLEFDFEDDDSLARCISDVQSLFLIPPNLPKLPDYVKKTIRYAREAQISQLVFLSILGAANSSAGKLGALYAEAESLIRRSEIPFTILRTNCLMQNILKLYQLDSSTITLPLANASVSFVDARDVAVVGADILLPGAHHFGKTYELTGPHSYTLFEIAEQISLISGRPLGYVSIPEDCAAYALEGVIPEEQIDLFMEYFGFLRQGGGEKITTAIQQIAAIEPLAFIDFLRDNASTIR